MRILVAGGHGFLGRALCARLAADGHTVQVLTRSPRQPGDLSWDGGDGPIAGTAWAREIDGSDALVNLAGESIAGGRWTARRKRLIGDSRVLATKALAAAIDAARRPPAVMLSASAIGIYGPHGDEAVTEDTPPGRDFLADVATAWEAAALPAAAHTRVVLCRTGLVLDRHGGALPLVARPFWFGLGGRLGSGRQYWSWIHLHDWVEMAVWVLGRSAVSGALNATAPVPVTNAEFARTLARVLRRPAIAPVPACALRLLLGEMAGPLILSGARVLPAKAEALGFTFRWPDLESALREIYQRRT